MVGTYVTVALVVLKTKVAEEDDSESVPFRVDLDDEVSAVREVVCVPCLDE